MCELNLSRVGPARRFRLSPASCLLLCLLSLLTAARCSAPNMELESDRVPIETPFQSSHHSYQESNDKLVEQDHLVSDSTYPGRENPLTSSSMEQVDESHYHGYETLPIKSSEVNVASQTSLDSKNSLQNDVTDPDKNSNRKLQDDDVIQSPSHEASSDKDAPEGNLYQRKSDCDGKVEGEESSFANRLDKSFEEGKEVYGEAGVQQGAEQDAFADKIDETQPTPHADDDGLSEGSAETRQENGDNSESPSSMKEDTSVDKNVHEEGEERDVVEKEKTEDDDKMADIEKREDSSEVEEVQTESSEMKEDKEESSSRMPEEEVGVVSEGGGELGGVSRKEGAGHSELDDVDESSDDDMMTFEEFKQKKMEEAQQSGPRQVEDQPPPVGVVNVKSKNNYASVDCGAKVIRHNPEAKNTQDILKENKDAYMINPCSAKIWFVVELCELVSVRTLEIASFELFSSTPESFNVYASERFEENVQVDWVHLGKFHAEDERRLQQFPLDTYVYAKYIKVDMLSHYGNEHYCPLSLLRVLGASMMDIYEESQQQKEKPPPTASSVVLTDDLLRGSQGSKFDGLLWQGN